MENLNSETEVLPGDYTTINGAWYLESLPNRIVAERVDGVLFMFNITPFRRIIADDYIPYNGYHPRKCKGQPMPEYLYRFYGLSRNDETLSEVIRVRVAASEKEKLETTAANVGKNVSEFLREYIRSL